MDTPDLRQLRYFLAVAEELHFGRAAERVGIAQPPLTQQIRKIERLLGCALFVRSRGTRLTEAGAELAEHARRLLALADEAFERTRRVGRGEAGELRVGVPPSIMLTELPTAVRRYRERYPGVHFTLRELATSAIEEALRSREIDLGFLREAQPDPPLRSSLFLTEAVVAALPSTHALAGSKTVALPRLKPDPFVLFPRRLGPAFHDTLLDACREAGFVPEVVQEATQWQTVVSLVEAGMGVSLAPECVSRFRRRLVVFRPIPGLRTRIYASWREEGLSPAAETFLRLAAAGKLPARQLR
ncbi:MAG: LysR substrate-binding domain-containing protein [Bryobacteraceae bacterium]